MSDDTQKTSNKSQGAGQGQGQDGFEEDTSSIGKSQLSQSLMLEERSPGGLLRVAAVGIFIFVILFIVWATNTRISEVIVSSGEISPFGSVKNVQHLEGGIVKEIFVRDGDLVDVGEVLMIQSHSGATSELDQYRVRMKALELEADQLLAIATGKSADVEALSSKQGYKDLATVQIRVFEAKRKSMLAQLDVIDRQIAQRVVEREHLAEKSVSIKKQIDLIKQQLAIRSNLMKQGLQPKLVWLDNQRELARTQTQLIEVRGMRRQLAEGIGELNSTKAEINARLPMEAAESLGKVTAEIEELKAVIAQVESQVARLKIRSPVKGVVQNLRTQTVGGVIPGGETIAEIIPSDVELKVEARIATEDIGFIFSGQHANVKVLTYDYTRFGDISGTIERISATTNTDETGKPFYLALIKLDRNYVGDDPNKNRVVPGMTVISDIRTGEKSLTEYLLKPIYLAFSQAFRER